MISWIWLIPAVVTGAFLGVLILAVAASNRGDD